MSRAEEAARKAYPVLESKIGIDRTIAYLNRRIGYEEGYEQAEKGIISLIESRIGEILGDAQPAPVLRAELQELIKRIKEEQK